VSLKANQQAFELVHPGKGAFGAKASLIDLRIEQTLATTFRLLAIARVLGNVWNQPVIEAGLARRARVKGHIGVEISTFYHQAQLLDRFERRLQMDFEIERIVVLTRENTRRSHHVAMLFHERQDIAGLPFLAPLIGDRLAAFLGEAMRAVQVEFGQVQVGSDGQDAVLPDPFQTAIVAPTRKMQVDRTITDFFFSESARVAIGNCAH